MRRILIACVLVACNGNGGGSSGDDGVCLPLQSACTATDTCCGVVCDSELGRCCAYTDDACTTSQDCCTGLCTSGKCVRQPTGGPCVRDHDCVTDQCTQSKCVCTQNGQGCLLDDECCSGRCDALGTGLCH